MHTFKQTQFRYYILLWCRHCFPILFTRVCTLYFDIHVLCIISHKINIDSIHITQLCVSMGI